MCIKHWKMVSPAIQQRIYDTRNEMRQGKEFAAYHQAISDAEQDIIEKQNKELLTGTLNHAL